MLGIDLNARRILIVVGSVMVAFGLSLSVGNLWISYSTRVHAYDTGRNANPCKYIFKPSVNNTWCLILLINCFFRKYRHDRW